MHRRFDRKRRRQPVATWGFLRPHHRKVDDERAQRERLRKSPLLMREYKRSLVLQLSVIGVLTLSCLVLLLQSIIMLRSLDAVPAFAGVAWVIPTIVGFLGLAALRRFLRVLSEYREFHED